MLSLTNEITGTGKEALICLTRIGSNSFPVFVSNGTIYEAYRLILHKLGIQRVLLFLNNIYDGSTAVERITEEDEKNARQYLQRFSDQPITYIDALNLAIMKRIGIFKAFAFDYHYTILGFVTLPPFQ